MLKVMAAPLGCLLLGAFVPSSSAQSQALAPEAVSAQSVSGQFIIFAQRAPLAWVAPAELATNRNFLRIEPMVLPSSCERIKELVGRELGVTAPWRGRVTIALHPATGADEAVNVISQQFMDGWQYRVEMPDFVERVRYVRAMVNVLLLELANRTAAERSAEIPTWLSEGLTRQLLVTSEADIVLLPPRSRPTGLNLAGTDINARRTNPLAPAHRKFQSQPPLTFEELSWPSAGQLAGEAGEVYADSAQLFVTQLLRLRDGRASLRAMVEALPRYYNWQFAFLHAYGASFQRPIDVAKWWELLVVHFTGRDLGQAWPAEESWRRLGQAIRASVQVRVGTNGLPMSAEVPLQTIIRGGDPKTQTETIEGKLRELALLKLRLAREVAPAADDYSKALEDFLQGRERTGLFSFRKNAAQRRAADEAVRQLDLLDARLAALKAKMRPALSVQVQAGQAGNR